MMRTLTVVLLTLFLRTIAISSPPSERQDKLGALAAEGRIQEDAPVKATSEIAINASLEKVWQTLTEINDWPLWQTSISSSHINGVLEPGTTFTWTNGGTEIKSRISVVRRNEQIGWTGTAYHARAIHIWALKALPNRGTLVETKESMDGFLLAVFYSSKDLAKSHEIWLRALKHKAEQ